MKIQNDLMKNIMINYIKEISIKNIIKYQNFIMTIYSHLIILKILTIKPHTNLSIYKYKSIIKKERRKNKIQK